MGGSASFSACLAGFGFDLMIEGGRRNQQKKKKRDIRASFHKQRPALLTPPALFGWT